MKTLRNNIGMILWYLLARYLPKSTFPVMGKLFKRVRYFCAKLIFESVESNVNLENMAYFGRGDKIRIGENSGIGTRCRVPSNIEIGKNVMMAEEVTILVVNHEFSRLDIPMIDQGVKNRTKLEIEDDVWIGTRAIVLPQVTKIGKGAIIGAGTVLTRNVPPYSIVGGNPSRMSKKRGGRS